MAWSQVSQEKFADAARILKTALTLADEPTSAWIPGEQLYGAEFRSIAVAQNEALWDWLQQRPESTDRLLLCAAFQQLQRYTGTSRELLSVAAKQGLDPKLVAAMKTIAQDVTNPDDPATDRGVPAADVSESPQPMRDRSVVGAGGFAEELGSPQSIPFDEFDADPPTADSAGPPIPLTPTRPPGDGLPPDDSGFSLTIPTPDSSSP